VYGVRFQTHAATLGLFLSLIVSWYAHGHGAGFIRSMGLAHSNFLLSAVLLIVSLWIRLKLRRARSSEMKDEEKPRSAAGGNRLDAWGNLKNGADRLVLARSHGQAVVWYCGNSTHFFLQKVLRVDGLTLELLIAAGWRIATPFFLFSLASPTRSRKQSSSPAAFLRRSPISRCSAR